MATYNRNADLESTIRNIFEQDYSNMELIVIDDGSTDNTLEIMHKLQRLFPFRGISNVHNVGLQKSLNSGIGQSTGKYIARIDDHDKWIDPSKLSKQVAFLESNPEVGLVGTGYTFDGKSMLNPLTDSAIRNQILMRSPFCHVSVVMVKSVVVEVGGYDEQLSYSEDWDLWLKIGKRAQLANLPDITTAIQEDDLSLSKDFYLKQMPINQKIVKQYYDDYPQKSKALLYHQFIRFFFAIFPVNGKVHDMMKIRFLKYFALTPNKNSLDEPSAK
tara:strand:- start:596 stop:1414 length:819 start_codon:yes stop_codon:yes gene_type:complete